VRLGILHDRIGAATGGAERHTLDLALHARAVGHEVVLATLPGGGPREGGIEHLAVPAPRRRPARDRAFAANGVRALREAGCDTVIGFRHCPGVDVYLPHGGLVGDAIAAQDAARGGAGPFRRLARAFSGKTRFFLEAERRLLGGPEGPRTICVSGALDACMRATYPAGAGRTVVIPNGVDLDRFEPSRGASDDARAGCGGDDAYVGLLLAMHPRLKGAETAIRAMRHEVVEALEVPFHLVVAGGRLEPALQRLVRRTGLAHRVHELGFVDDPRGVYAAADVLVHATYHDPCSLACLEALAMGLPVITTPVNGVAELMGPRGGIVLEEVGSADALAVALGVLADEDLRRVTSEDARRVAEAHPQAASFDRVLAVCNRA
jgi:UDP-glucose:(heptosyl)LPS alpha-1,3-glucosyltransferase